MIDYAKLIVLIKSALETDGEHHKQWYIEQIALEVGLNPAKLFDGQYEEGVVP